MIDLGECPLEEVAQRVAALLSKATGLEWHFGDGDMLTLRVKDIPVGRKPVSIAARPLKVKRRRRSRR